MDRVRNRRRSWRSTSASSAARWRGSRRWCSASSSSRGVQQQRGYEFERVDLVALVRETVLAFERSLSRQRLSFLVDAPDPRWSSSARSRRARAGAGQPARQRGQVLGRAERGHRPRRRPTRIPPSSRSPIAASASTTADQARIFEKFYRGGGAAVHRAGVRPRPADRPRAGAGAPRPGRGRERPRRGQHVPRHPAAGRARARAGAGTAAARPGKLPVKRAAQESPAPTRDVLVVEDEPQMRAMLDRQPRVRGLPRDRGGVGRGSAHASSASAPFRCCSWT